MGLTVMCPCIMSTAVKLHACPVSRAGPTSTDQVAVKPHACAVLQSKQEQAQTRVLPIFSGCVASACGLSRG